MKQRKKHKIVVHESRTHGEIIERKWYAELYDILKQSFKAKAEVEVWIDSDMVKGKVKGFGKAWVSMETDDAVIFIPQADIKRLQVRTEEKRTGMNYVR